MNFFEYECITPIEVREEIIERFELWMFQNGL